MEVNEIFTFFDSIRSGGWEHLEPPNTVTATLFPYQKEALGWLVSRENSLELPPFWIIKNGVYVNELTNYQTSARPEPFRGGIFADDMGLGKTLTLVSLIAFDKWWIQRPTKIDDECNDNEERERGRGSQKPDSSKNKRKLEDLNTQDRVIRPVIDEHLSLEPKTTLIVCNPCVLSTWLCELLLFTRKDSLKVDIFDGEPTRDANDLQKFDLILTTYSILGSDESLSESPINEIEWRRVILDEAHVIKNLEARQNRAVIALNSKRRWAVTGTPVQNNSFDLFALVAFLKLEPLSLKFYWESLIERPLIHGDKKGISRLQLLIAAISLRRTKIKETIYVDLNEEERNVYDQMELQVKDIVATYLSNQGVMTQFYPVLGELVRLRQICTLCPSDIRNILLPSHVGDVKNNPSLLKKFIGMLQDNEDFNCPICISPPTDIVITCCAHVFCQSCILKTLKQSKPCCPLCRNSLSESDLFKHLPQPSDSTCSGSSFHKSSSKVAALLKLLSEARNAKPCSKSIISSQFQKVLLSLEGTLKQAGFKVVRLDEAMNAERKAKIIQQFRIPAGKGPAILLTNLQVSSDGIKLTSVASTVYLLEPWWNPADEDRTTDKLHRIGQANNVVVVKLITRNTIEERLMLLLERRILARQSFGRVPHDLNGINDHDLIFLMNL